MSSQRRIMVLHILYYEFKDSLIHRICHLALDMAAETYKRENALAALNHEDKERIYILQDELSSEYRSAKLQGTITDCLTKIDKIIADPAVESKRNAQEAQKRVKLIFNV